MYRGRMTAWRAEFPDSAVGGNPVARGKRTVFSSPVKELHSRSSQNVDGY